MTGDFALAVDQDVERLAFGQDSVEADADQLEGRLELRPSAPGRSSGSCTRPCSSRRACTVRGRACPCGRLSVRPGRGNRTWLKVHSAPLPRILSGMPRSPTLNSTPFLASLPSSGVFNRPTRYFTSPLSVTTSCGTVKVVVGHRREAVVGNHEHGGIIGHLPQHAAHVLPAGSLARWRRR